MGDKLEQVHPGEANLSEREIYALRVWRGTERKPLSPDLNARFFALFLAGKTCEEIRQMNQQYTLGDIVHGRLKGDWDRRRDEHLDELLNHTRSYVQQVQLEQVRLLGDMLTAADLKFGDAVRRYIQSRNDKDLEGFGIQGLRDYKTVIELWMKLTGQDNQKRVGGEVVVTHRAGEPSPVQDVTSDDAGKALAILVKRTK